MKIEISEKVYEQLDQIAEYISQDNEHYAPIFINKIFDVIYSLADFPKKFRIAPEFNDENIRDTFFKKYRIIYRIDPGKIYVLSVVHGSRDLSDEKIRL